MSEGLRFDIDRMSLYELSRLRAHIDAAERKLREQNNLKDNMAEARTDPETEICFE